MKQRNFHLLILFGSLAALISVADRAPLHLNSRFPGVQIEKEFNQYLYGVTNQTAPGPFVHRILLPHVILGVAGIFPSVDPMTLDFVLKFLLLCLLEMAFYRYLSGFFNPMESLAGVFLLMALVGFSFSYIAGPSIMETGDVLNAVVFVLAFSALHQNKFALLCAILFVGTLNRESTWILMIPISIAEYMNRRRAERIIITLLSIALPYFAVRMLHGSSSNWFMMAGLARNIPFISKDFLWNAIIANVHFVVLVGPLLLLSLYRFKERPRFLQVASSIVPLFILVHYAVAWIIEARIWIPLFLVLIPLSLESLKQITGFDFTEAKHST